MCVQGICQVPAGQKVLSGASPSFLMACPLPRPLRGMAWPDFRSPPAVRRGSCCGGWGWGCETSSLPGPGGCYLHSACCFPSHILCQRWVKPILHFFHHFLSLNICSYCKTTSKLRTLQISPRVTGTIEFQRQEPTLFLLSE